MSGDPAGGARKFVRRVQRLTIVSGAAVGAVIAMVFSTEVAYGFWSGTAVGIVGLQLMAADAYSLVGRQPQAARKYIIGRLFLRIGIMFGFLALIAVRTDWDIFAAFAGILFSRIVMIGVQVVAPVSETSSPGKRI